MGGEHNKFKFTLASKDVQTKDDLLAYADSFCLSKWLIKHEALASGFTSNFIPSECSSLELQTSLVPYDVIKRLNLYLPTLDSVRKVCSKSE